MWKKWNWWYSRLMFNNTSDRRKHCRIDRYYCYLIAKRKMISSDLQAVMRQLSNKQKEKDEECRAVSFLSVRKPNWNFWQEIAAVPIDAKAVDKEIKRLESALKAIRKEISSKTKSNTKVIMSLYENMVKYASELGVGNSESIATSYLFTSNLKELSGCSSA